MAVCLDNHSDVVTNHPPLYEWTRRGQGARQMRRPLLTPGGSVRKFSGDFAGRTALPSTGGEGRALSVIIDNSEAPRGLWKTSRASLPLCSL